MRRPSFRVRIALLSATLAGTTLVGFGILSWLLIYDARVSRLDAELSSQLLPLGMPRSPAQWQAYRDTILPRVNARSLSAVAVQIRTWQGPILYQSENWLPGFEIPLSPPPLSSRPQEPPGLARDRTPRPLPQRPAPNARLAPPPATNQGIDQFADPPPGPPPGDRGELPQPQLVTRRTPTGQWRVGAAALPRGQITIAVSLTTIDQEMAAIRNSFLIVIPAGFFLVALGAWTLSGTALDPIQQLTTSIQKVSVRGLDQRLPIGTIDIEFRALVQVFNQMLERLDHSFQQASRFSADAAHELKTPLTILQGELERMLREAETESRLQQRLSTLLDEVRRLSTIVRKLLLLSLADAGQISLHRVQVDLATLLTTLVEDIELLAPDLSVQTTGLTSLWVQGDRDLLIQALQNLISNAIKYNQPHGWITIHARQQATAILITVTNSSQDIPQPERSRIFDRFQRGDPAHNRHVEGIGLGLSLAREIIRAHGGDLRLDRASPGQTAFTVQLPILS